MNTKVAGFILLFVSLSLAHLMLDPEQEGNSKVRNPHVNYNALHQRGCTGDNSHERACESACSCRTVFAPTVYPDDIPPQVRTAFEFSKCIWSCVLKDLPITRNEDLIRITVSSFQSASLTLATGGGRFTGISSTQFGICGVESVRGSVQCNSLVSEDITININTDQSVYPNFYFGLDCNPAPNQIDFVSVALHEIGHGLGFSGLIANNNIGYQSAQLIAIIDTYYTVGIGGSKPWTTAPPNAAAALAAIVSNNLFFDGVLFDNGKLYVPLSYEGGSSVYHWDEATYPAGDINSLMTPVIGFGEAIHAIGPLTCDYLTRWGYPISNITELCGADVLAVPGATSPSPTPTTAPTNSAASTLLPAASQSGTPTNIVPSQSATPTRPASSQSATPTRLANSPTPIVEPSQTSTPTAVALSLTSTLTPTATVTTTTSSDTPPSVTPVRPITSRSVSRSVPDASNVDRTVTIQASRSSERFSSSANSLASSTLVAVLCLFVCIATLL